MILHSPFLLRATLVLSILLPVSFDRGTAQTNAHPRTPSSAAVNHQLDATRSRGHLDPPLPAPTTSTELLIDTGPGGATGGTALFASGSTQCSPQPSCSLSFQFLAGKFTLTTDATLNLVEGWMSVNSGGNVEVKIRANTNGLPGAVVFSSTHTATAHATAWQSFPNFVVDLPAGTYWISFEPVSGTNFAAAMPSGAPQPLPGYAFFANGNNQWVALSSSLGFRISGTRQPVAGFGTATRVIRKGDFTDFFDSIDGGTGQLHTQQYSGAGTGNAFAYGTIKDNGLIVGSEANAANGTGRAIAFRTFRNNTLETKTVKAAAVLTGEFRRAPWDLPTGTLRMGAQVLVLDPAIFGNKLRTSGLPADEFLLQDYTLQEAISPSLLFQRTAELFPGGISAFGQLVRMSGPDHQRVTFNIDSGFVTVGPQQSFVVMFDLVTYSIEAHGAFGSRGHGAVFFHNSLKPAPNFFLGIDGNPVAGITAVGADAVEPPPPTTITLSQSSPNGPLGASDTLTALVKDSQGTPVANQPVTFEVVSGPHTGLVAVGETAANGEATFTYTGTVGAGTDLVRSSLGDLTSNSVNRIWTTSGIVKFSQSAYVAQESGEAVSINVVRPGGIEKATVDYELTDVTASSRSDYTKALGTISFAEGETSKTITVLLSEDSYSEGTETLQLTLSNPSGDASLGQPSVASLTINDDTPETSGNPNDDATEFVRQHYHDFLNRDPDAAGLQFWTNEITQCDQLAPPERPSCREVHRINVSAAFFLSIEFQETGYLAYRTFKAAYGDSTSPNVSVPVPVIRFNELLAAATEIGKDVVVGTPNWPEQLENNKLAYLNKFVRQPRFLTAYPMTLTPAQFVDQLNQNTGGVLSQSERNTLVDQLANETDVTQARAQVLRAIADNESFRQQEKNRAFVLMQYFGYLRRNADESPDTDFRGWEFWLQKLNNFNGNFVEAEMVKAFIVSGEYRQRFGQ
jgi:hypothetical protein